MAEDCRKLGVIVLTSGAYLCVEGENMQTVMTIIRSSELLPVQWERVGDLEELEARLCREGRWSRPDAWVLGIEPSFAEKRIRAIRSSEGAVPIVIVAPAQPNTEETLLRAGADVVCRWPEDVEVLASRIHAVLRRASGTFPVPLAGNVHLCHDTRQLRVHNVTAQLSPYEYRLIKRLDESRNAWVPMEDLWRVVWQGDRAYDSSLLRMYCLRIRKKLGASRAALRTQRGRGMMLSSVTTVAVHSARR